MSPGSGFSLIPVGVFLAEMFRFCPMVEVSTHLSGRSFSSRDGPFVSPGRAFSVIQWCFSLPGWSVCVPFLGVYISVGVLYGHRPLVSPGLRFPFIK